MAQPDDGDLPPHAAYLAALGELNPQKLSAYAIRELSDRRVSGPTVLKVLRDTDRVRWESVQAVLEALPEDIDIDRYRRLWEACYKRDPITGETPVAETVRRLLEEADEQRQTTVQTWLAFEGIGRILRRKILDHDRQLAISRELEETLKEKNGVIASLEQNRGDRDRRISELERDVVAANDALSVSEATVASMTKRAQEKERLAENRKRYVVELEKEKAKAEKSEERDRKRIATLKDELAAERRVAKERDEFVLKLKEELTEERKRKSASSPNSEPGPSTPTDTPPAQEHPPRRKRWSRRSWLPVVLAAAFTAAILGGLVAGLSALSTPNGPSSTPPAGFVTPTYSYYRPTTSYYSPPLTSYYSPPRITPPLASYFPPRITRTPVRKPSPLTRPP